MNKIKIGKIINTHGVKGECKVMFYDDFDIDCFDNASELYLSSNNELKAVHPVSTRMHKGFLLIVFKEIDDMNKAEAIKNLELMIDEDDLNANEDGYYNYELVGLKVIDEEKKLLGVVKDVETTLAHDILRVERDNLKDLLVPLVDAFVLNIDQENNFIMIKVIDGLL